MPDFSADNPTPVYVRVADWIESRIESGELKPGARMPLVVHERADLQRGLRGCRERVGKCADVPELAEAHTQRRGSGVDGEPREA